MDSRKRIIEALLDARVKYIQIQLGKASTADTDAVNVGEDVAFLKSILGERYDGLAKATDALSDQTQAEKAGLYIDNRLVQLQAYFVSKGVLKDNDVYFLSLAMQTEQQIRALPRTDKSLDNLAALLNKLIEVNQYLLDPASAADDKTDARAERREVVNNLQTLLDVAPKPTLDVEAATMIISTLRVLRGVFLGDKRLSHSDLNAATNLLYRLVNQYDEDGQGMSAAEVKVLLATTIMEAGARDEYKGLDATAKAKVLQAPETVMSDEKGFFHEGSWLSRTLERIVNISSPSEEEAKTRIQGKNILIPSSNGRFDLAGLDNQLARDTEFDAPSASDLLNSEVGRSAEYLDVAKMGTEIASHVINHAQLILVNASKSGSYGLGANALDTAIKKLYIDPSEIGKQTIADALQMLDTVRPLYLSEIQILDVQRNTKQIGEGKGSNKNSDPSMFNMLKTKDWNVEDAFKQIEDGIKVMRRGDKETPVEIAEKGFFTEAFYSITHG